WPPRTARTRHLGSRAEGRRGRGRAGSSLRSSAPRGPSRTVTRSRRSGRSDPPIPSDGHFTDYTLLRQAERLARSGLWRALLIAIFRTREGARARGHRRGRSRGGARARRLGLLARTREPAHPRVHARPPALARDVLGAAHGGARRPARGLA